ncbi:hypothetical protein GQ55_5G430900 [Panicum hallii var. hallii]|uniref:Uncharacterized protein n=1 Tax=Panicum hallii var. hallii TaxID=1504633 RepID=A0A2T7DPB9_9POAL|nr:hypothetical protein GQ55_5G430900 [Panicum hallii var. hallii]
MFISLPSSVSRLVSLMYPCSHRPAICIQPLAPPTYRRPFAGFGGHLRHPRMSGGIPPQHPSGGCGSADQGRCSRGRGRLCSSPGDFC